jgi:DNA-binding NarL/FixJ family response regulator
MLSASTSHGDLLGALRAGAVGYLPPDLDPERLPSALERVLSGEAAVPRRLVLPLIDALRSQGHRSQTVRRRCRVELTRREWEVLELIDEGLTTGEAAQRLVLSPVTIRRHVSNVVNKLELADRGAVLALLGERR